MGPQRKPRQTATVLARLTTAAVSAGATTEIDLGRVMAWAACRASPINGITGEALSLPGFRLDDAVDHCVTGSAATPSTAFTVLQRNGTFAAAGLGADHDDPFFEDRLYLAPDINASGPAFYTLVWRTEIPRKPGTVQWLRLRGVNYGVRVFANGMVLPEATTGATFVEGMFRRSEYELPACKHIDSTGECEPNVIAIHVTPPPHFGNRASGQGGDHQLAKITTMQFAAGWDWISTVPDRNTGLWDKVTLVESMAVVAMSDPFMSIRNVMLQGGKAPPGAERGASAVIDPKVTLKLSAAVGDLEGSDLMATVSVEVSPRNAPGTIVGHASMRVSLPSREQDGPLEVSLPPITLTEPYLWYPHTHGSPHLYEATFSVSTSSSSSASSSSSVVFGIRKVEHYLHPTTRGRTFRINSVPIFLQGGNWIHTDQFLRYASDAQRYSDEVKMHAQMGMNIIRVWGGGLAERPEFYAAADEQGVLVMQEFWMTGDNNGRWAGNYSWPEDHSVFLACVRDTVLMLRNHPSLLFWCGGNELYPEKKSPPPDIHAAVPDILRELDQPGRFYIASSMSNYTNYDPEYALAPKDGPYGILLESDFYERNPGLTFWNQTRAQNLVIGFQPEIGSVSTPSFESMRRFMSEDSLERHFPGRDPANSTIHHVWSFHKYISYTTPNVTWRSPQNRRLREPFDHVSNFFGGGPPGSARDYVAAAAIVQMFQFQALFEGFQTFMWEYYSAVIMWKSQSPWPVLRGAFYDSWLKQTGGYWGVRRALFGSGGKNSDNLRGDDPDKSTSGLHIQLNLKTWRPTILNKGPADFFGATKLEARTSFFSARTGQQIASASHSLPSTSATGIEAQSVIVLSEDVKFPAMPEGETSALIRMQLVDAKADGTIISTLAENSYLRSDPKVSPQDYADLGALRAAKDTWVDVSITNIGVNETAGTWEITLKTGVTQLHPALFVELDIVMSGSEEETSDTRVLPIFWSDNLVTLLPGEQRVVTAQGVRLQAPGEGKVNNGGGQLKVRVSGWNVKTVTQEVSSEAPSVSTATATHTTSTPWYNTYREGMATPERAHSLNLVRDFHAVGDGSTLNTAAITAAIQAAAEWNRLNKNKGVEIVVPALSSSAVYLTAPVNLTSHLTLTINAGATLLASDDPSLWPVVPALKSYGQGRDHPGPRRAPFLGGLLLEDIVLRGPGRVDGSGKSWWARYRSHNETYTRGRLVEFLYSDGILLEDLTLENSPFWTVHPAFSSNVVARRLVICNPNDSPNTDGFDPDSTVNVSLTDSVFSVGDDGVAIKSGWDCFGIDTHRPSANIYIRNLTVNSPCCAGVCIGSEMSGGVENILVENLHLQSVGQGLRIKASLGRGGYVKNVTYRNVDMQNTIYSAIEANDFYGSVNPSCHGRDARAVPVIDGIVYENIRASGTGGVDFEGLSQKAITGVVMKNVTVVKQGGGTVFTCSHVEGTASYVIPAPCKELAAVETLDDYVQSK